MPRLSIEIPHALDRDEATRRFKDRIESARSLVKDLHYEWQDHSLTFNFQALGQNVNGTMAVEVAEVTIDLELPMAAMLVKGPIETKVRQEIGAILA